MAPAFVRGHAWIRLAPDLSFERKAHILVPRVLVLQWKQYPYAAWNIIIPPPFPQVPVVSLLVLMHRYHNHTKFTPMNSNANLSCSGSVRLAHLGSLLRRTLVG